MLRWRNAMGVPTGSSCGSWLYQRSVQTPDSRPGIRKIILQAVESGIGTKRYFGIPCVLRSGIGKIKLAIPVTKYRRYAYNVPIPCFLINLPVVTGYLLEGNKYTGYQRQGFI